MTIEWGGMNLQSNTTCQVLDPGQNPTSIIASNVPFRVRVEWTVPTPFATYLGGSFRLRCFAESVGPGQERRIGSEEMVTVIPGQTTYQRDIVVPAFALRGEEEIDPVTGDPVSGIYRLATVIQHINGVSTMGSGFADAPLIQVRTP